MKYEITKGLRKHLTEKFGLAADASDDTIRNLVSEKLMSEEMTIKTLRDLTASDATVKVKAMIAEEVGSQFTAFEDRFTKNIQTMLGIKAAGSDGANTGTPSNPTGEITGQPSTTKAHDVTGTTSPASTAAATTPAGSKGMAVMASAASAAGTGEGLNGGAGGGTATVDMIRVKSAVERYDDTRTAATYAQSGSDRMVKHFGNRRVSFGGGVHGNIGGDLAERYLDMPTDRQKAIAGVWLKHMIIKSCRQSGRHVPGNYTLNEHERDLLNYAVHECKFVGPHGYRGGDRDTTDATFWLSGEKAYNDLQRKALLDDSTSGGLEAVPIEFDDLAILTPLLSGEVFPRVRTIPVTRRRIEAASIGNPNFTWGVGEGSPIGLFTTDSFISAFDNTIFPVTGAMEIGMDFMADSPLAIGTIIQNNYGSAFRKEMDNVLCTGDGTTQPEGVFTASGLTTITPGAGAGGVPQVGDYESLIRAVPKEFRNEAGRNNRSFLMTDVSYFRVRGIPVDSSADERRIFGMDHENYRVFDLDVAINGSLTNAQQAHVCWNRYRLYRRAGLETKIVDNDRESVLRNTMMLALRARFGGALDHSSAASKITAGQV